MTKKYASKYTEHEHDLADPRTIRPTRRGCKPHKKRGYSTTNWRPKGYFAPDIVFDK